MARKPDPLAVSPNWHIDCRLEAELPEDKVVGRRFLLNALAGLIVVVLLLLAGWLAYKSFSLRYQIHDWEQRIATNNAEVHDLQRMQSDYRSEADKIDHVYPMMMGPMMISRFVASIGRTLPPQMTIDVIDGNEAKIVMRGNLRETSERASHLATDYLEFLRNDKEIGPYFRAITLTDLARNRSNDEMQNFEITFYYKPPSP